MKSHVSTSFRIHDTEYKIVLNNGMGETSGFMGNTSVKIVERESVEQLSTTHLNSINMAAPISQNTAREML